MNYLSVCSGIESASVAWHVLGWQPVAFAEIDKFAGAVLQHHYPAVPNWGDVTRFKEWPDAAFDVLVGGTPCQSFSVAGLRKGLDDPRGNLALVYLAIAARYQPRWLVWENVPGVLSSNEGRDFGSFVGGMGQLGYGWAYRILDAQFVRVDGFGRAVPQRRRRVFVVGYLGDWRRAAAVLFERESLHGNSAPRREAGQSPTGSLKSCAGSGSWANSADHAAAGLMVPEVAPSLAASGRGVERAGESRGQDPLVAEVAPTLNGAANDTGGDRPPGTQVETADSLIPVSGTLGPRTADHPNGLGSETEFIVPRVLGQSISAKWSKGSSGPAGDEHHNLVAHSLRGEGFDASDDGSRTTLVAFDATAAGNTGFAIGAVPGALRGDGHGGGHAAIAFAQNSRSEVRLIDGDGGVTGAIAAEPGVQQQSYVKAGWAVRRLTPRECERLQGFPDDYTRISAKTADGPRYKALGNAMSCNVMRWLGRRIELVSSIRSAA